MMAEKSCIGMYASRLKKNKANPDHLEIEIRISQRLLLNHHTNKIMTLPASADTLFFREPRSAFISPDRDDDQRGILSTIIRGIQTPFPLQDIHWTLAKFPRESDNTHTLDEIIASRLTAMAHQCANDDQFTSMVIHLTKLEKVDEFPEQNNRQLLEQHLGDWIRENPESEARAVLKCLEAILERRSPVENRYYEVRSVKMGQEVGEKDCSICMTGFKEGKQEIRMPCSHIFHGLCLVKWLENAPNCPLCRFRLC